MAAKAKSPSAKPTDERELIRDLAALLDMIDRLLRSEAPVIEYARNGADFSVDNLNERMDRLNAAGGHHLR